MRKLEFSSTMIEYALYDEDASFLQIYFRNGQSRDVANVSVETVDRFKHARSAGIFYMTYLRHKVSRS